ncbi:hypothetical protein K432DRAFT_408371 [Lepidopterella palustris CBS 459.81]|uniref:Uncharacterized protein n=1 Tax=Lepidopterella palustris CBS 459.81 TaxID=1314670 RepID=A0A8E2JBR3_9PEZI|nr:hypothetical protein K432DRAFT_408371 [Lepidopterella palustris CBS 459.81]
MSYQHYGSNNDYIHFPPTEDFNIIAQSTRSYPVTDGYTFDPSTWLESDGALEFLPQGEPPNIAASKHDTEATLVGSLELVEILKVLQGLKESFKDLKGSFENLKREVSESKDALSNLQEKFGTLQEDIHHNSSALSNVDKYIESHKKWTWDFREGVESRLQTIADSSKLRK